MHTYIPPSRPCQCRSAFQLLRYIWQRINDELKKSTRLVFLAISLFIISNVSEARTIIVLMDGTWNEPKKTIAGGKGHDGQTPETWEVIEDTGEESNVAILYRYLLNDTENQQILYYEGIGTEGGFLKKVKDGAFGSTATAKVLKAYDDLSSALDSSSDRDNHIAILGFSRGATTSRLLANKIAQDGIGSDKISVDISFLGLWDTVAALGVPDSHLEEFRKVFDKKYKELIISKSVKEVIHFVSIDEVRSTFEPTLLNLESPQDTIAKEIWYPGGHSDVGGGWPVVRDKEVRLSDLTLYCMIKALKDSKALDIKFKDDQSVKNLKDRVVNIDNISAKIHAKSFDPTILVSKPKMRQLASLLNPSSVMIDYSVKFRKEDRNANYDPPQLKNLDIDEEQWSSDCYMD